MVLTPLLDALGVEIVAFVTRERCYHIISLEVLQTDHTLFHFVKLLLVKEARQLAEIDDTVHARRLSIVRLCTILMSNVVGAAFPFLIRSINTSITEQKSTAKDQEDNRKDTEHYELVVLEETQDNSYPVDQPVTFMCAPYPALNIAGIFSIKVCVAHYEKYSVNARLQELIA